MAIDFPQYSCRLPVTRLPVFHHVPQGLDHLVSEALLDAPTGCGNAHQEGHQVVSHPHLVLLLGETVHPVLFEITMIRQEGESQRTPNLIPQNLRPADAQKGGWLEVGLRGQANRHQGEFTEPGIDHHRIPRFVGHESGDVGPHAFRIRSQGLPEVCVLPQWTGDQKPHLLPREERLVRVVKGAVVIKLGPASDYGTDVRQSGEMDRVVKAAKITVN